MMTVLEQIAAQDMLCEYEYGIAYDDEADTTLDVLLNDDKED